MKLVEIQNQAELDAKFEGKKVLGIDESGVGDYLTPLTAAVAVVDPANFDRLRELGVGDSKKIADSRIRELAKIIEEEKLAKFKVSHIGQKGYNNMAKRNNANLIKMFVHLKAFTESQKGTGSTIKTTDFDYVFIDQYSTLNAIQGYFDHYFDEVANPKANWAKFRKIGCEVVLSHKAEDKHLSVAVASIMARALLLSLMDTQNAEFEANFPLGASNDTQDWINNFVKERAGDDENAARILRYNLVKSFKIKE